jgi:hypothetical protein
MPRAKLIDVDEIPPGLCIPIKILADRVVMRSKHYPNGLVGQYLFKFSCEQHGTFKCWLYEKHELLLKYSHEVDEIKDVFGDAAFDLLFGDAAYHMLDAYKVKEQEKKEQAKERRSSLRSAYKPVSDESQRELETLFGVVL